MDFRHLLEQAQNFQRHLAQIDEDLGQVHVTATAGGGVVEAQVDGLGKVTGITIDPELLAGGDAGLVQQTVLAAVTQAQEQAHAKREEQRAKLLGDLQLPDL